MGTPNNAVGHGNTQILKRRIALGTFPLFQCAYFSGTLLGE